MGSTIQIDLVFRRKKMTQILYLNTETQKLSTEVEGGFKNIKGFGLSLVTTYDTDSSQYRCWLEQNLKEVQNIFQNMDLIIGFNLLRFDYVLLQPFFNFDLQQLPTFDILKEVELQFGSRLSLNNIAKRTLGKEKSRSGEEIVSLWKQGELDELSRTCCENLGILKSLFEHGCREKYIEFWHPKEREIRCLNTSHWASKARELVDINMPF